MSNIRFKVDVDFGKSPNPERFWFDVKTSIVCSDILSTLHELFYRHKTLVREVLQTDYDHFFGKLNELLSSDDYYIRRKSIKLLETMKMF